MDRQDRTRQGGWTTKARGDMAEDLAWAHLHSHGLRLVQRNYRTPGRGGGEIDLICWDPDGTLVFVEVRQRSRSDHGGALASISVAKRRRIVWAARHFLLRLGQEPPCRFDVVVLQSGQDPWWLKAAFDALA